MHPKLESGGTVAGHTSPPEGRMRVRQFGCGGGGGGLFFLAAARIRYSPSSRRGRRDQLQHRWRGLARASPEGKKKLDLFGC